MSRPMGIILLVGMIGMGCSSPGPDRKETCKVSGQVLIDGQPVDSVAVYCTDVNGIDTAEPTMSACFTGTDGRFALSTYEKGDGVPPGEYTLTFLWGQFNMNMQYGGPDKLHDRYMDATKSTIKFTVEPGEPKDLGKIELTTK